MELGEVWTVSHMSACRAGAVSGCPGKLVMLRAVDGVDG
jgi:hypothetical protein